MNERDIGKALRNAASNAPAWTSAPTLAITTGRKRTRRNRGVVAGVIVAACIAGAGGWRLTNDSASSSVPAGPVPGPGVSVLETAKVYMRAAASGDCAMTHALESPKILGRIDWCHDDPKLIKYKITGPATPEGPPGTAVHEQCVPTLATTSANSEGSMYAGTTPWSWCFVKTDAGWRLHDQGAP